MNGIRKDFPVLTNNPELVYLDSACTSLKPSQVIDAEMTYYRELGACGGRSSHRLGRKTSDKLEESREKVAAFVGGSATELIWTRNATEALNIVARGMDYSKRKVVVTNMEHHSALLPWIKLRDQDRIELEIINCESDGEVPLERFKKVIDRNTALVVSHSWNNTTGTGRDVRALAKLAHENGALICVDGAQGIPHHRCDFKRDEIDFLCFSGHKMLGPTGIGALMVRKESMKRLDPLMSGGGTVKTVTTGKVVSMDDQTLFEAGIQNYSGIIGFAAACEYLKKIGMEKIEDHEKKLAGLLRAELTNAGAIIYGPTNNQHGALFSFSFKDAKPHDVALMLDKDDIALRSGFFCAQPAMEAIGAKDGAVRASAYIYNTPQEIRKFGESLQKIKEIY